MTAPAVSTDSTTAPSATPLEQDLGQMFGDYSGGGETPEPETSAAGTTPAEPAAGTADGAEAPPEPKDGASETETPSDGTTPAAAPDAAEDDPFKDTTPAEYVVNGQTIPVEDIRVFKEGGAVIRPESLPNVLSKLAERDTLAERIRTRDAEYTTLSKVSEWTDQSSGKTYTGPDAAIEMRIGNGALLAENQLMLPVLTAADLQPYLTTKKVVGEDGTTRETVVFRPDFIESLAEKARFQREQIDFATRKHYAGVMAESSKPAPAPLDHTKATDVLVADIAKVSSLDASVLTPADKALLAKQLPRHIETAKDGSKQASLEWQELVKDRIQLRTEQKAATAKLVPTITDAAKKGMNNMAAAARGMRQAPKTPAVPPKTPTPAQERAVSEGDLYDMQERAAAAALRAAR